MRNFTSGRSSAPRPLLETTNPIQEDRCSSQRAILHVLLKSTIAIVLSLFAWEIIVRNTIEQSPGTTKHPILGRIYNPGDRIESGEGFSRTRMNSLGMRNDEILPKAQGEFRVLSIGDSFTSAEQVEDAKTYSARIGSTFKQQNSPVTVINGGRTGATPAYYLHLADFYKTQLQPDAVIVQINDSDFTEEGLDPTKEFYIRAQGNTFQAIHNQDFASDDRLSQLFQQKFPQLSFMLQISTLRVGGKNLQAMLKKQAKPTEAAPTKSQGNYDRLIEWTVVNLKAKYPNLVILHIPYVTFNNPNEPPNPAEAALIEIAEKHKVPIVAMRRDFVNYHQTFHQPTSGFNNSIPGTGHINEIGHELIAQRLVPLLEAMRKKTN